jgi:hypothetical protein
LVVVGILVMDVFQRVAKGLVAERTNLTFSYELYNVGTR